MAREIHEIKSFNTGLVCNADNKDTPDESAIFSYGVDGNAPGGVISGILDDGLVSEGGSALYYNSSATLNAAISSTTATSITLQDGETSLLLDGWYIRIDSEIMKVTGKLSGETLVVQRGELGTTAATHADDASIYVTIVPRLILPIQRNEIHEDLLIADASERRVDLVKNFKSDSAGEALGESINASVSFPFNYPWSGEINVDRDKDNNIISFGKNSLPLWIGYVAGKRFSGQFNDYYIYEARCKPPPPLKSLTGNVAFKSVLFEAHESAAGAYTDMAQMANTTKALAVCTAPRQWTWKNSFAHVYKDVEGGDDLSDWVDTMSRIYVTNPDTMQSFKSKKLIYGGETYIVRNLAKCVSCKTAIKVWVYAEKQRTAADDYKLGKVFLVNIHELNGVSSSAIDLTSGGTFDRVDGFKLTIDKVVNLDFATDHTKGYPSRPDFRVRPWRTNFLADFDWEDLEDAFTVNEQNETQGSPSYDYSWWNNTGIGDIMETIDNSGNGKLWILLCPIHSAHDFDNDAPLNDSFQIADKTEKTYQPNWTSLIGSHQGGYQNPTPETIFYTNLSFNGANDWTEYGGSSIATASGKLTVTPGGATNRGAQLVHSNVTAGIEKTTYENAWKHPFNVNPSYTNFKDMSGATYTDENASNYGETVIRGRIVYRRQYIKLSCASGTITGFRASNCDFGTHGGTSVTTDLIPVDGGTTGTVTTEPRWFYYEIRHPKPGISAGSDPGDGTNYIDPSCSTQNFVSTKLQIAPSSSTSTLWHIHEMGPSICFDSEESSWTKEIGNPDKHRFLFCSYEDVDGDWTGGAETDVYLNDKSMPLYFMNRYSEENNQRNHGMENMTVPSKPHSSIGEWWGYGKNELFISFNKNPKAGNNLISSQDVTTWGEESVKLSVLQRSVPKAGGSSYTEPSVKTIIRDIDPTLATDHRAHCLVNGGSWWYRDNRVFEQPGTDVYSNQGFEMITPTPGNSDHGDQMTHTRFSPRPNSLMDVSDLYGVNHVVSSLISIPNEKAILIDDIVHVERNFTTSVLTGLGVREYNVANRSIMWISSGGIENYGCNYVRQNSFGYGINTTTEYTKYENANLSTMVYDKANSLVRLIKILPKTRRTSMNGRNHNAFQRNCLFPNVNWSGRNNETDSHPEYHTFIESYSDLLWNVDGACQMGTLIKNSTTAERGDTYADLVSGGGTAGVAGYNKTDVVDANFVIQNDSLADAQYKSPKNDTACVGIPSGTDGDEVDSIVLSQISNTAFTGSPADPDNIVPNGPYMLAFFGGTNSSSGVTDYHVFNKLKFNGYTAGSNTTSAGKQVIGMGYSGTNNTPHATASEYAGTPAVLCFPGIYEIDGQYGTENAVYDMAEIDSGDNDTAGNNINFGWPKVIEILSSDGPTTHDIADVNNVAVPNVGAEYRDTSFINIPWILSKGEGGASASNSGENFKWGTYGFRYPIIGTFFENTSNDDGTWTYTNRDKFYNMSLANASSEAEIDDNDYNWTIGSQNTYGYIKNSYATITGSTEFDFELTDSIESGDTAYTHWDEQAIQDTDLYGWGRNQGDGAGITREYRLSFEYDGVQESPLSAQVYFIENTSTTIHYKSAKITLTFKPSEVSKRVSAVCVYRKNREGGLWNRVVRLSTTDETFEPVFITDSVDGVSYSGAKTTFTDTYANFSDYALINGVSTDFNNLQPAYNCSVTYGGHLFVGDVNWAHLNDDFSRFIFRSNANAYNTFSQSTSSMIKLPFKPIALASFGNRIYAFTRKNLIKLEPSRLVVENIYEGFGLLNKNSIVTNDYGIFWADDSHIYQLDGSNPKVISYPIEKDLYSGAKKGWRDLADANLTKAYYDLENQVVMWTKTVAKRTYTLKYHLLKSRWDLEVPTSFSDTEYIVGGNLFQGLLDSKTFYAKSPDSEGKIRVYQKGKKETTGKIQYWTKEFTMGHDNVDKRFIKLKITASGTVDTPVVEIDGIPVTLVAAGTNEWKINKKGKRIQLKWGSSSYESAQMKNSNITMSSIGIVYRRTKVK